MADLMARDFIDGVMAVLIGEHLLMDLDMGKEYYTRN